jgi:hypothetical protein
MSISPIYVGYSGPDGAEVLIIGEAPGSDETRLGQPFVGKSGELLREVLTANGFLCASAEECEVSGVAANDKYNIKFANLSCHQPLGAPGVKVNDFSVLDGSDELRRGIVQIRDYIKRYGSRIKVCILLGGQPLQYMCEKYGISNWRGSVLESGGLVYIPTYHPSFVSRVGSNYSIFSFDIQKAFRIYQEGYRKPTFDFAINPSSYQIEDIKNELLKAKTLAIDIETIKYTNQIICIGFAASRSRAVCIANRSSDDSLTNEFRDFVQPILEDPSIEKVFHNGLFDIEILHNNHIETKNFTFDTMVAQHVLAPGMEKGLDYITGIFTDIPYYKDKGRMALPENEKGWGRIKDQDKLTIYEYNCLDCVATFWCYEEMLKEINADEDYKHIFSYEMSMHEVAFPLMRNGMPWDIERRDELKKIVEKKYVEDASLLKAIVGEYINIGSVPKKKKLLYETWGLPERKNDGKVSTDEDAIVGCIAYVKEYIEKLSRPETKYEWQKKLAGLMLILKLMGYRKLLGSYIDIATYRIDRVRSVYKVTGTETGRWSCSKYYDDTGLNAQTMPRESIA